MDYRGGPYERATVNEHDRSGLKHSLFKALFSAGAILPAGLALNYLLHLVLARALSVADFGLFAYVQSLASVLALLAALGFSTSLMRFIAAYRVNGQLALLRGVILSSARAVSLATLMLIAVLLFAAHQFSGQRAALLWATALVVPLTVDVWRESCMRGLQRTAAAILPRQVLMPAVGVLVVVLCGVSRASTALAVVVVAMVVLEWGAIMQLRKALGFLADTIPTHKTRAWLASSLPMGGTALATLGITRWDLVAVGACVGVEAAGTYAAASRTALLASLAGRVVNLVVGPFLAELYHAGELQRFRRLIVSAAVGTGFAGAPLVALVLWHPQWALNIFGEGYRDAALLLQVLVCGQFVNLLTGPAGLALAMSSHERLNLMLTLAASVLSLVGLAVLIPTYGALGAALATSIALIALNLTQFCTSVFVIR